MILVLGILIGSAGAALATENGLSTFGKILFVVGCVIVAIGLLRLYVFPKKDKHGGHGSHDEYTEQHDDQHGHGSGGHGSHRGPGGFDHNPYGDH